jgi:uncharacterized delta-60 repeat protein
MWNFFLPRLPKSPIQRLRNCSFRPQLEALEDRWCPSGAGVEWSDPNSGSNNSQGATANACALQADGKILAAGWETIPSSGQFILQRYTTDGNLDTSFGSAGTVITKVGSGTSTGANGVAVQSDGKIVLAGEAGFKPGAEFALARYTSNGSLDTTFGSKGIVNTQLGSSDCAWAEVIQPDGKIIAAGTSAQPDASTGYPQNEFALARYNTNGSLDKTFGSGGKVLTAFGNSAPHGANVDAEINAIALQSDGKIVVAGYSSLTGPGGGVFTLVRYNSDGSLDTTFGPGQTGIVTLTFFSAHDHTNALVIQPDGKIIAVGSVRASTVIADEWGLARLNADGSLDTSFGSGGEVSLAINGTPVYGVGDVAKGVVLQSDGKIMVAGNHGGSGNSITVGRFNQDGSLDTTFEGTGLSTIQIGSSCSASSMVIEPTNGPVIVAGVATVNGVSEIALVAFAASNPQIGSFIANPNPVTSGNSTTLTVSNIIDSNPSSTITQVALYVDSNADGKLETGTDMLIGYATQTSPGVWTFTFTVTLAPGTYTLFAQAEDNYGLFSDPFAISLIVQ